MGNEPSIAALPESWHRILPNITRDSILQYSYRYRHYRSTRSSSRSSRSSSDNDKNNINADVNGDDDDEAGEDVAGYGNTTGQQRKSVYLEDDIFDLDEHVPTALAILTAYPHLKDIRFKLVPGVLKEERFWECVFGVLNDFDHGNGGDSDIMYGGGLDNISETQGEFGGNGVKEEAHMTLTPIEAQSNAGNPKAPGKIGEKLSVKPPISNLGAYE